MMKMLRRLTAAAAGALALFLAASPAAAQSGCSYIAPGAVLTAGQWNQCFANKQDYLGFVPLNPANLQGVAPITLGLVGGIYQVGLNYNTSDFTVTSGQLTLNVGAANTFGVSNGTVVVYRAILGPDLPTPTSISPGGIFSAVCSSAPCSLSGIDNTGTPTLNTTTGTGNAVFSSAPALSGPNFLNGAYVNSQGFLNNDGSFYYLCAFDTTPVTLCVNGSTTPFLQWSANTAIFTIGTSGYTFVANGVTAVGISSAGTTFLGGGHGIFIDNAAGSFGANIVPNGGMAAGISLTLPAITGTFALQGARSFSTPANPTGTNSTTVRMAGLAGSFTPTATGNALLNISGSTQNNTATDGCTIQLRYGTGTAPTLNQAITGTIAGNASGQWTTSPTASSNSQYSITAYVTGLTVGTTYWLDAGQGALTGGTCNMFNTNLTAIEE